MISTTDSLKPIAVEPPDFAIDVVAARVDQKFGLQGDYSQLVSERDQNFRLKTADGACFVVKVTSLVEDCVATDFQIATLIHLEESALEGAPRIVRTASGTNRSSIRSDSGLEYCLRVVTWIDGELLKTAGLTTDIAGQLGQRLADMDVALECFEFDGDGQASLWDMQKAGQLRPLLVHVDDVETRRQVEDVLDRFDSHVESALKALPCQVIHNDANPDNILLDEDRNVSGIIDFGDSLRAPRVIEIATAAAYLRADNEDRLRFIAAFVSRYHQRSPILETEFALLFDLIRTRLSMTLILLYWRLAARDENDPYRQKNLASEGDASNFLVFLSALGRVEFNRRVIQNI